MKQTLIIGGVAATAVGVTIVATTASYWKSEKAWVPLSEEIKGQESVYGNNSFGRKYGRYLYGVKPHNKHFWEKKFNGYYFYFSEPTGPQEHQLKDKFSNVNKEFSDNASDEAALNTVCNDAYKLDTSESNSSLVDSLSNQDKSKYIKDNIWKYCSPGLFTISEAEETIAPETGVTSAIGADNDNKKLLVSASYSPNDWFWKIRESEWDKKGTTEKSVFHNSNEPIKDLCAKAYKKSKTDNPNNTDALKFCSVNPIVKNQ